MTHSLTSLFRRTALLLSLTTLAFAVTLLPPVPAAAQADDARLTSMLEQAIDDYDMLMLEDAESGLEGAVRIAQQGKASGPVVARVFIMLGVVRFATGDEGLTEEAFVQALEQDAKAEINPVYQTPTLNQILERARKRAKPPTPVKSPDPVVTASEEDEITHTPVRRAQSGQGLPIEVHVPENMPIFRVFLYYRHFGQENYTQVEMSPTSNTRFAHTLGGSEVRTSQLDYYIEAVNRSSDVVARSARATSPHNVSILGSSSADPVKPGPDPKDPKIEDPDEVGLGYYGILLMGTDLGFLPGGTPTANRHREVSPGIAAAFAHTKLDLGVMLTPTAHLGLYFRWQFSPAQNFQDLPPESQDSGSGFWNSRKECMGLGLPGDCMLGLKYKWVFSTGTPEFYSSVGGGVGRMRNWLRLKQATSSSRPDPLCEGKETFTDANVGDYCYIRDTVRTGWAHFGVGGGMFIPLTDFMDFSADTYLIFLVPETSINFDLSVGLRFRL